MEQEETFESISEEIKKEKLLFEKQIELQRKKWVEDLKEIKNEPPKEKKETLWGKLTKIFSYE